MADAMKFAGDDTGSDGQTEGGKGGFNGGSLPEVDEKWWGIEKVQLAVESILAVGSGVGTCQECIYKGGKPSMPGQKDPLGCGNAIITILLIFTKPCSKRHLRPH